MPGCPPGCPHVQLSVLSISVSHRHPISAVIAIGQRTQRLDGNSCLHRVKRSYQPSASKFGALCCRNKDFPSDLPSWWRPDTFLGMSCFSNEFGLDLSSVSSPDCTDCPQRVVVMSIVPKTVVAVSNDGPIAFGSAPEESPSQGSKGVGRRRLSATCPESYCTAALPKSCCPGHTAVPKQTLAIRGNRSRQETCSD